MIKDVNDTLDLYHEAHKLLRERTAGQPLPLSEELGKRIICVPIHPAMSEEDNTCISAALIECIETLAKP